MGVSLLLGMGLGALGGCMIPLEVFSPPMKHIAHITPQAWGNDAFTKLGGDGASILSILAQLGILAAYAVVLLALATWRLRCGRHGRPCGTDWVIRHRGQLRAGCGARG